MHDERQAADYDRFGRIMAAFYNYHRDRRRGGRDFLPSDFNPYEMSEELKRADPDYSGDCDTREEYEEAQHAKLIATLHKMAAWAGEGAYQ